MRKLALLVLSLAGIAGLGFVIDAQSRIRVERPPPPAGPRLIFAPGRVEGATPEIELRPQLAGRIQQVLVREGQSVEPRAILLQLDDAEHRHEIALANAELALANAQLERLVNGARPQEIHEAAALYRAKSAELQSARLAGARIEELYNSRAVSQQAADDQRSLVAALGEEAEAARARLERLEAPPRHEELLMEQARTQAAAARLELAKVQWERASLRAPCGGQVLAVDVEAGELTGPDSPRPAVVMADTTRFRVRAFIEEMDAPRVPVGARCTITADGLPDRSFFGRVAEISPRMTAKQLFSDRADERYDTKVRDARIELDHSSGLVVGLRVDVTIDPQAAPLNAVEPRPADGGK